ncbi:hypothetical protein L211DRAFT_148898 [Terfezia boudieri ATCC MYA-4762]|uniref:Uncharacterized protein n=1 Tax=Terfezia boudieri ATCC MYA-4762 TaxID=1051890 RepID=A0A3N4M3A3_9PEZI|nr:hypothetical protein L211DRAFT_148898 [Terfezia boudieri ATCC MYA-4762]
MRGETVTEDGVSRQHILPLNPSASPTRTNKRRKINEIRKQRKAKQCKEQSTQRVERGNLATHNKMKLTTKSEQMKSSDHIVPSPFSIPVHHPTHCTLFQPMPIAYNQISNHRTSIVIHEKCKRLTPHRHDP